MIVKCDVAAIIGINAFQCNDGPPGIAADIVNHGICITETRFGINIKAILIIAADKSFRYFERRLNA